LDIKSENEVVNFFNKQNKKKKSNNKVERGGENGFSVRVINGFKRRSNN
jgi:hypothetical protein